ncbi:DnaD domain-containing protein [Bacillus timonensis]|nr:DnaD domain-containing protein [Bacillus timonensis]
MKINNVVEWFEQGNLSIPNILMNHYKKLNLNEEEFMLVLHVFSFINNGNHFPTPTQISERMTLDTSRCMDILRSLLQRGFLEIDEEVDFQSVRHEKYSLTPLWEKLFILLLNEKQQQQIVKQEEKQVNLYTMFEQEFGRPLSPFECETLSMWIDQDNHDPLIIKAALREAVMSGKLNFRYIDRILFEWKKNGVKTIEQAQNHSKKFRQPKTSSKENTPKDDTYQRTIPFYNWLENE